MESQTQHAPSKKNDIILKPSKNLIPSILVVKNVNSSLCPVAAGTFADLQISSQVFHGSRKHTCAIACGPYTCKTLVGINWTDG